MKYNFILLLLILLLLFIVIKNSIEIGKNKVLEKYVAVANPNYQELIDINLELISEGIDEITHEIQNEQSDLDALNIDNKISDAQEKIDNIPKYRKTLENNLNTNYKPPIINTYCRNDIDNGVEKNYIHDNPSDEGLDSYFNLSQNSVKLTNQVDSHKCGELCSNLDSCYSFLYIDNEEQQQCILSSTCSGSNNVLNDISEGKTDMSYDLYQKKNVGLTTFPLINYTILQNKKCKSDIFPLSLNDKNIHENTSLRDCASKCNDINTDCLNNPNKDICEYCIAFEYNNQNRNCTIRNNCYDGSGDQCLNNDPNIDLYSISDKTNIKMPRSRQCVKCGEYLNNVPYIKFYSENKNNIAHNLVFTKDVYDMNNMDDKKFDQNKNRYFSISEGYQIQLFQNRFFDKNGDSIWLNDVENTENTDNPLPYDGKYDIRDLIERNPDYAYFNSFKFYPNDEAIIQQNAIDCKLKALDIDGNPQEITNNQNTCIPTSDYNNNGTYYKNIYIDQAPNIGGSLCKYNYISSEGISEEIEIDNTHNVNNPYNADYLENNCDIDCRGSWSGCQKSGLNEYVVTNSNILTDNSSYAKPCHVGNRSITQNIQSNLKNGTSGDVCPMSNVFRVTRMYNWPIDEWSKKWIALSSDIVGKSIGNALSNKDINHIPFFEITSWGEELYLKLQIGDEIIFDKSEDVSINKIGISADIRNVLQKKITVDFADNTGGYNLTHYGFLEDTILFNIEPYTVSENKQVTTFHDTTNNVKYISVDDYNLFASSADTDCVGSWVCEPDDDNKGGTATYVITLDKMGNGKPCPYTHGQSEGCVPPHKRLGFLDGKAGQWSDKNAYRTYIYKDYTDLDVQMNNYHDKIDCLFDLGPGYDVTVGHDAKDSGGPTFSMRYEIGCPVDQCYFKPKNGDQEKIKYRTGRVHYDKKSREPTTMGMQGYLCGDDGDMFIPSLDKSVKRNVYDAFTFTPCKDKEECTKWGVVKADNLIPPPN